jgi:ABC-type phosphate transport system substrate-binding protein
LKSLKNANPVVHLFRLPVPIAKQIKKFILWIKRGGQKTVKKHSYVEIASHELSLLFF